MVRPMFSCLSRVAIVSVCLSSLVWAPSADARGPKGRAPGVKISGVHFDGQLKGTPEEPDAAIRLSNTHPRKTIRIGGWLLSSRFTPRKRRRQSPESADNAFDKSTANDSGRMPGQGSRRDKEMQFPEGVRLKPGQDIWIANKGDGFLKVFGFKPDYEAVDTLSDVPNLDGDGFVATPAKRGTIALIDGLGRVADFVPYDANKEPKLTEAQMPSDHWQGPPLYLAGATSWTGWSGRVLARDRDEAGKILPDTDSAADWDCGFSAAKLGVDPTHRVEMAGQSLFTSKPMRVKAKVWATSAPDNNYQAFIEAINGAKKSIRVSVYQITNPKIADAFIKAKKRGVDVRLWLEGSPVGGIPDQERYVTTKMHKAGIPVHFLVSDSKTRTKARYRFDHSKYVIIDEKRAIIGTENYGRTGMPIHNSFGNRGWMIHIENPVFVRQLLDVWNHDYRPGVMRDVRSIDYSPDDQYGMPYRKPGFQPDNTIIRGLYFKPKKPAFVDGKVGLELVLSPDTSLNENSALIGMMNRAKKTLFIQQNSIRKKWGSKNDPMSKTPDLPLEAVIAAARRGVKTRVLLDGTWYNVTGDDDRNNDDTVALLNGIARREGLDLRAKVINLDTTHLVKIHAKGIIVDDNEVFVGSINWTENSFKGNREVGVVVTHPKIAGYYASLFRRDWAQSRMYTATLNENVRLSPTLKGVPGGSLHETGKPRRPKKLKKGATVSVVGELGGKAKQPAFLEVATGLDTTAYIPADKTFNIETTPTESIHVVGRKVTVEGRVVATRVSKKVIQLWFEREEHPPFTAVIFRSAEQRFRNAGINPTTDFQGRQVRLRGRVETYKSPEIILKHPDQIEFVDAGAKR